MNAPTTQPLVAQSRALVLLAVLVAGLLLLLASAVTAGGDPVELVPYRVGAGDTLWEIAGEVSGPQGNVRAAIDQIKAHNDVSAATLQVGDVIMVPTG